MARPFYIGNIQTAVVESEEDLNKLLLQRENKTIFYATRKNRQPALIESGLDYKFTCQFLPEWVQKVNVNDWTSRASIWRVWEIKGKKT